MPNCANYAKVVQKIYYSVYGTSYRSTVEQL